jgi:hypothetical protein
MEIAAHSPFDNKIITGLTRFNDLVRVSAATIDLDTNTDEGLG